MRSGFSANERIRAFFGKNGKRNPNSGQHGQSVSINSPDRPDVQYSQSSHKTERDPSPTKFRTEVHSANNQALEETKYETAASDELGGSDDELGQGTTTDTGIIGSAIHSLIAVRKNESISELAGLDELFRGDGDNIRDTTGDGPDFLPDHDSDSDDGSFYDSDGHSDNSPSAEMDVFFTGNSDSDGGYGDNQ